MPKLTSVRLSDELASRLAQLAEALDRPRSWLMEQAIARYVDEEAWQVAAITEALDDYQKGGAKLTPHAGSPTRSRTTSKSLPIIRGWGGPAGLRGRVSSSSPARRISWRTQSTGAPMRSSCSASCTAPAGGRRSFDDPALENRIQRPQAESDAAGVLHDAALEDEVAEGGVHVAQAALERRVLEQGG